MLLAVAIRLGPGWLAAGVGGALGGAVLLTPSRRRGRRARELAWEGHMRAARLFDTLLSGAFELRASGRDHALRTILSDVASGVARAERDGVRYGAALAALPLGLSAVLALAPSAWLASLVGARVGEAAVLATAGASFVLAALSAYEAVGRSRPLRRTFEEFEGRGAAAVAEAQASPDANPTPLDELTLEAITVRYPGADRPVVADLSARVRRGAGVALLGPNGVGKTTTLLVALGLLELDQGRVLLDGRAAEASRWAALRSRILVLPQRPHLVPEESIAWHLGLFGTAEPTPEKIERALERVGLLERLRARSHSSPGDIPMGALSAGEQRRVLLARAFVDECDLVVLDEPEAGLDDAGRADLKGLLGELARHRLVLAAVHDTTILPSELTRVHLGAHETDVVVDGRAGAPILS
ncbi:MAG: ATP-binding cassette domain-containing protein [Polyangiaceae bacterium]